MFVLRWSRPGSVSASDIVRKSGSIDGVAWPTKNHTLVRLGKFSHSVTMTPFKSHNLEPMKTILSITATLTALALTALPAAAQSSYSVSLSGGGNWQTLYAQGFSTSLGATPPPGAVNGDPVNLTQFQFFKSGTADTAANIQLAIFNTLYPNLTGLTTSSPNFIGLSANTIASTAGLSTGDAITFTFSNLGLVYGSDYGAYFVNVSGINLTPVRVSALASDYAEVPPGSGTFHPVQNYGTESQFQYATGNFISGGGFLSAFSFAGDAMFNASLTTVPEPSTYALMGLGALVTLRRVLRRKVG